MKPNAMKMIKMKMMREKKLDIKGLLSYDSIL